MDFYYYYETALGRIGIGQTQEKLTNISFTFPICYKDATEKETPLLQEAFVQIKEYLEGTRMVFDLPIQINGTEFQKNVWKIVAEIPYGTTLSYGEIAKKINIPKGARAVGMAVNKNPLLLLIPCHRVLGKNGDLIGYAGGIDRKKQLLNIEQ